MTCDIVRDARYAMVHLISEITVLKYVFILRTYETHVDFKENIPESCGHFENACDN